MENYLENLDEILSLTFQLVRKHLKEAQIRQKTYYDQKVHGKPYKVGDLVWRTIKRVKQEDCVNSPCSAEIVNWKCWEQKKCIKQKSKVPWFHDYFIKIQEAVSDRNVFKD